MRKLLVLAALPLLLAACGGGGSSSTTTTTAAMTTTAAAAPQTGAAGDLQKAVAATTAAKTEKTSLVGTVAYSGASFAIKGAGGYDQTKQAGTDSLTLGLPTGNTAVDEVFDGDTIWLKSPLIATALPSGKQWIEIDLATTGKTLGYDFKALTGQTPGDVLSLLTYAGGVTKLGTATIGGVATTEYRAAIDPSKIPASDENESITHATYQPVDVWVDADGLIRQVTLDFTARVDPAKPPLGHVVLTMGLSDFGSSVDTSPPPAAQVESGTSSIGGSG